ncbi:STAS domain-containing protein [Streptomyces avermitilis]|uniref:STAS domain-containing protein n=1 Tax=Streptomyces avermitilis TaxID=33903 RepID=UPI0033A2B028
MTDIEKADRPERLSVEHRMVDGVRVVTVQGEIDHDVREVLSEALLSEDGAAPPSRIVVDLSGVTFVTPPPAEAGGFSLCRVGVATDQPGP